MGKAGKETDTCGQCLVRGKQGANQPRLCMGAIREAHRRVPWEKKKKEEYLGLSLRMLPRAHHVKKGRRGTAG